MQAFELPPGKHIGVLRDRLQRMFDAGELEGGREAAYYVDAVRTHDLLADLELHPAGKRGRRT
jgi:poly(A) polymerase